MSRCLVRAKALIVGLLALGMAAESGMAQLASVDSASDQRVRDWIRAEVPRLMKRLDVPGAVVTIVRGDRLIVNDGFGVADVLQRTPVNAATTVFRIASVAKVFSALAILRAAESRHVGLSQDIRPFLADILSRDDLNAPITLHQLLTHTAGFDEQLIGYINRPGVSAARLAEYLKTSLPPRSRAPGDVPGYSNHGFGLAGLLAERLTGLPFDRYARDSVFRVVGMPNTAFLLDPAGSAPPNLAREYRSNGSVRVPRSSRAYPAGNVGTTGSDMAAFMRWVLAALRSADTGQARARLVRQLAGPMLTYDSALPPMGYGFNGVPFSGRVLWMKGGAAPSHSAVLALIPELDIAFFIALNRQEPLMWDRLIPRLVATFWADTVVHAEPQLADATKVAGDYLWTRAPLASPEKLLGLAAQLHVETSGTGIDVSGPELSGHWMRVSARTFRDSTGRLMAFRPDTTGYAALAFAIVQGQPVSFERIGIASTTRFQLGVLVVGSLLALSAAFAARAHQSAVRWTVLILPLADVAMLVAALMLARQSDLLPEGPTGTYRVAILLTTLTGVLSVTQMLGAAYLAVQPSGALRRLLLACGAAGGLGIAWFLGSNHLIG
ncbi:MAG: serine hydrolase domain-containing protein [Gemmatimonadota bacterium]